MLIGRLAEETGLSRDTVRYYERRGLISAAFVRDNGYKDYGEDTVARLRFVRMLQSAGFTLRDTAEFLELYAAGQATCENVGPKVTRHLESIDERIAELQRMRADLVAAFELCESTGPEEVCTPIRDGLEARS